MSASSSKICSRPTPTRSAARPMPSPACRDEERARGVWTISAGNAGQAVAYAARAAGIPCSVVAIETAPQTKLERMRALGATHRPGLLCAGVASGRGACFRGHATARSSIPSTTTISSPATAHGPGDPRGRAGRADGDRRDRRRRADHRRRQRHQGAASRCAGARRRSRRRPRLMPTRCAKGRPTQIPRLAGVVRRRRRRPERHASACGNGCRRWSTARSS